MIFPPVRFLGKYLLQPTGQRILWNSGRYLQHGVQGPHLNSEMDFNDHRKTYAHLETAQLLRGLLVLRLCSWDFLLQNSIKLLQQGERFLGRPLLEALLKPTLYKHFVAGDDPGELEAAVELLKKANIRLMLLPSLEEDVGEKPDPEKYDRNLRLKLDLAKLAGELGGPKSCLQTKITAVIPAYLLLKIAPGHSDPSSQFRIISDWANYFLGGKFQDVKFLSRNENQQLEQGLERLKCIGESAVTNNLRLLVDGEYTYLNPAISITALSLAGAFNDKRPVVWNTYQCYLKGAFDKIWSELEVTRRLGVCFGAKIVRGAYLERERLLAAEGGYEDPTNNTYEATSAMYDRVVEFMTNEIATVGSRCNIIVASHNESSIQKAVSHLKILGIKPEDDLVVFGQIYGMALNISVKLASEGYIVYNSVPYGGLFDVLPYLSRRATENRAVLKGTRREQQLLINEIFSRISPLSN